MWWVTYEPCLVPLQCSWPQRVPCVARSLRHSRWSTWLVQETGSQHSSCDMWSWRFKISPPEAVEVRARLDTQISSCTCVCERDRWRRMLIMICCVYQICAGLLFQQTMSTRFSCQWLDAPSQKELFVKCMDGERPKVLIYFSQMWDIIINITTDRNWYL